jgi:hypothetical protein
MAISGVIEFHASSGAPSHPYQIDPFIANSGQEHNRLGWFGDTGPGSFVTINTYQDKTFPVNEDGNAIDGAVNSASGELQNLKYINSSSVNANGSGAVAVSSITLPDSTLRVRFTEPSGTAVTIQNAELKCVNLNAASGVDDEDALASGVSVQAFEVGVDTTWTKISDDAASNAIDFDDRPTDGIIHDFHIGLSLSPIGTGEKVDFGFLFKLEYI